MARNGITKIFLGTTLTWSRVMPVLFIGSAIFNALLVFRAIESESNGRQPIIPNSRDDGKAQSDVREMGVDAMDGMDADRAQSGRADCRDAVTDLSSRLRDSEEARSALEAQIASLSPLEERFARGQTDSSEERALAREFRRMFASDALDGIDHSLECRGHVCRLVVLQPLARSARDWLDVVRDDDRLEALVRGRSYHGGIKTVDQATKEQLYQFETFLGLTEAAEDGELDAAEFLWNDIEQRASFDGCFERFHETGELEIRISAQGGLVSNIDISLKGNLGASATGACVRTEMQRVARNPSAPADMAAGSIVRVIRLP